MMKLGKPIRLAFLLMAIIVGVFVLISCQYDHQAANHDQSSKSESLMSDTAYSLGITEGLQSMFDNSGRTVTPTEELNHTGVPPEGLNITEYRLTVDGLVDRPLTLSYDEILAYSTTTKVVLLICPGYFEDNAEWTGVPVETILKEAGIKPEAREVIFSDFADYTKTLPLELARKEGVFLAHSVNGEVLPLEHGYPLRLVAEGRYGSYWVKWIQHIEVR